MRLGGLMGWLWMKDLFWFSIHVLFFLWDLGIRGLGWLVGWWIIEFWVELKIVPAWPFWLVFFVWRDVLGV